MLKLQHIQTYYGNIQALKGISIHIEQGEIVTLIGANGAGKTTTLMSICGITPPRKGEVFFMGEPIAHRKPEEIVKLGICQVPE
ncbi:MAG: ATP-binding cassette domain-containing protein, partial [Deltaproteobacteria bacterium]|nr:ATP-binding cassette domain-containing protein [Deltaproteobacteria bacterium]